MAAAPDTLSSIPVPSGAAWTVILTGSETADTVLQHEDDTTLVRVGIKAVGTPDGYFLLTSVSRGGETTIPAGTRVLAQLDGVPDRTVSILRQPKTAA